MDVDRVLMAAARAGHAHWLFGNLYEAVVRVPDRLAEAHDTGRSRGPLGPASPLRYYAPVLPVTLGATAAAVIRGWHRSPDRPLLAVATCCTLAGTALTGHLVRTVNLRLFDAGSPLGQEERRRLLGRWYRVNRVRLVLVGASSVALEALSCSRT